MQPDFNGAKGRRGTRSGLQHLTPGTAASRACTGPTAAWRTARQTRQARPTLPPPCHQRGLQTRRFDRAETAPRRYTACTLTLAAALPRQHYPTMQCTPAPFHRRKRKAQRTHHGLGIETCRGASIDASSMKRTTVAGVPPVYSADNKYVRHAALRACVGIAAGGSAVSVSCLGVPRVACLMPLVALVLQTGGGGLGARCPGAVDGDRGGAASPPRTHRGHHVAVRVPGQRAACHDEQHGRHR